MRKRNLTIKDKLITYKIDRKRYHAESIQLLDAGFTQQQADKIIVRPSTTKTVTSVLTHYDTLLKKPYFLSIDQIVDIASKDGGNKAIEALLRLNAQLLTAGFSKEEIVAMASNNGGAKALDTVLKSKERLLTAGFSKKQILAIASNDGGRQAMLTVLKFSQRLLELRFSKGQIVTMASRDGGSTAIKTVLAFHVKLQALDFSNEQIVAMASKHGGAQTIQTVLEMHEQLALNFSNAKIVSIASNHGGSQAIKNALKSTAPLQELNLSSNKKHTKIISAKKRSPEEAGFANESGASGGTLSTSSVSSLEEQAEGLVDNLAPGSSAVLETDMLVKLASPEAHNRPLVDNQFECLEDITEDDFTFFEKPLYTNENSLSPIKNIHALTAHGFFATTSSSSSKRARTEYSQLTLNRPLF